MTYPHFLKGFVAGYILNVSNAQITANNQAVSAGVTTGLRMAGDGAVPFSSDQYQAGSRSIWLNTGFNGKGGVITDEILGRSNIFVRATVVKIDTGNTNVNVILRIHNNKNDPDSFIPINSGFVGVRPGVERPAIFGGFHGGVQALSIAVNSDGAGVYRLNGVYFFISELI
jgi:hypothetical protein